MADPLGPITAGRRGQGLLSFRLGPIPVTVHGSFLVILGFLGLNLGDPTLIAVWVVVGAASVLLHELGHAVAALVAGFRPTVDLAGMGGVTSYATATTGRGQGRGDARGWSLLITGAGPGIQVLAGLAALPFMEGGFGLAYDGDLVQFALSVWVVVSLLWGVLNLVPILPLDGGQLFRNLVPGSPSTRTRVTEVVSVLVAAAGLVWGLLDNQTFVALLAAWFGFANVQSLVQAGSRSRDRAAGGGTVADRFGAARRALEDGDHQQAAELAGALAADTDDRRAATMAGSMALYALEVGGHHREAYRMVADPRHGLAFDDVLVSHALAMHPDRRAVWAVLAAAGRQGADARLRGITAVVAAAHDQHDVAALTLAGGPVSDKARGEVVRLADAAHATDGPDDSGGPAGGPSGGPSVGR